MVEMKLRSLPFKQILSGKKTYEIRLNDEKRKNIKVGDIILFRELPDLEKEIKCKVIDVIHFENFEQMAKGLDANKLGFESGASIQDIVDCYHGYYLPSEEKLCGVVAFEIELI